MLVIGTLSGIQDYLFDILPSGGGQARSLRARSFRIQLLSELVATRLLRAAKLPSDRLILRAAAKFAIDATGLDTFADDLQHEARSINAWLRDYTQAQLRFSMTLERGNTAMGSRYLRGLYQLQREKLQSWRTMAAQGEYWNTGELIVDELRDQNQEVSLDRELGRVLTQSENLVAYVPHDYGSSVEKKDSGLFEMLGYRVGFTPVCTPHAKTVVFRSSLTRFARYVPLDTDGYALDFAQLARRSCGAELLGVLKADVDSLGQAVSAQVKESHDLTNLQGLSQALNDFFGTSLDQEMRQPRGRWSNLYTIFSGGDDVLLVGPWNVVLDFAGHMNALFNARFSLAWGLKLTLSTGISLIKPKMPVHLGARQAEALLSDAKTSPAAGSAEPKDQIAALGGMWKWKDHSAIIAAGKQLAEWVQIEPQIVQRGWLQTILDLCLWRRGDVSEPGPRATPALATSRLVYHIARNWPKPDSSNVVARNARSWIDARARSFDQVTNTNDVETDNLPVILRYAILATRSPAEENES